MEFLYSLFGGPSQCIPVLKQGLFYIKPRQRLILDHSWWEYPACKPYGFKDNNYQQTCSFPLVSSLVSAYQEPFKADQSLATSFDCLFWRENIRKANQVRRSEGKPLVNQKEPSDHVDSTSIHRPAISG